MSSTDRAMVIVGGGLAGARAAEALRDEGFDGPVVIVGDEPARPYQRPPLSKEYLRGEAERSDAYVNDSGWYEDNDVELLTGTSAVALDAGARTVKLQSGEEVGFGKALLATGAMVNILRVDGAQLEGIHYLRAFGNSDSIRHDVADAERVVIVGGSYIGAEVAASLTEMGKECTILTMEDVALSGGFGEEVGRHFHELLESRGVTIRGGETLAAFEGDERVERVLSESGLELECEAVIVGAGVRPDTMLAGRAGLEVDDGIVCDAALETSVEGIFAAGDCCNYESRIHGRRLRVEHWDVAFNQGAHAARAMLGDKRPYEVVPYFFSDLSDWASLEYVGPAERWDEVLWRGGRESGEFSAWYVADDRVAAALSVGRSEDLQHARRLIASGAALGSAGRAAIADLEADLDQIA